MTDELSIQQKRPSATPYLLGGAAVGGAAGYAVDKWVVSKPMSHEDIIAEVNAKDKFEARISEGKEVDAWKDVQSKTESLKQAESKLEAASKPTLAEGAPERVNFENAEKAYNAEIEKLTAQRKAVLEAGNGRTNFIADKVKKFSDIPATELPTEYAYGRNKGKPFKGNELETLYNNLTNELTNAENNLQARLNRTIRNDSKTYTDEIQRSFDAAMSDLGRARSEDDIARYFENKYTSSGLFSEPKPTKQYQRAINIANKYYPEVTSLTDEQFLSIGRELEKGEAIPKGYRTKTVTVKNEKGWNTVKTIIFEESAARDLLKAEQEKIATLRTEAADEIFAQTQRYHAIKLQEVGLNQRVIENLDFEKVVEKSGLYDTGSKSFDFARLEREAAGSITHGSSKGGYYSDIAKLNEAIKNAKKAGGSATPVMPGGLNGNYGPTATVEEALAQAHKRQEIFKKITKERNNIKKQAEQCLKDNPIIREFDQKIANELAGDKAVQRARQKLADQFPKLFGESASTAKLTTEEIATQSKAWAESNVNKSLKNALDSAKSKLDEAISKSGKVDTAAKEAAEKAVAEAKTALKEATSNLGKKMGKGGKAGLCIAGGAALTGLLATMFRPKA